MYSLHTHNLQRKDKGAASTQLWAMECCAEAARLEDSGDYEVAAARLSDFWGGIGVMPNIEGLEPPAAAELLLRAGTLSGWIGSARQIVGAQEAAKDLISASLEMFERLLDVDKSTEALIDLAICYWRAGANDEARSTLKTALDRAASPHHKIRALSNLAMVEGADLRLDEGLQLLLSAAPLVDASSDNALKGRFFLNLGTTLKNLAGSNSRENYLDRALVEFEAASYHLEQANHSRYQARVENNIGLIYLTLGKTREAHDHLDKANRLFLSLKDTGSIAQVNETRARVYLLENRHQDAEQAARLAVQVLEKGDESALLSEALTTQGVALARGGNPGQALHVLERAIEISVASDNSSAGALATVCMLEELWRQLSRERQVELYLKADQWAERVEDSQLHKRFRLVAQRLLAPIDAGETDHPTIKELGGCSLAAEVKNYEGQLITKALARTGSVTQAAKLLNMSHQALSFKLKTQFPHLQAQATGQTRKPRQRSIIKVKGQGKSHPPILPKGTNVLPMRAGSGLQEVIHLPTAGTYLEVEMEDDAFENVGPRQGDAMIISYGAAQAGDLIAIRTNAGDYAVGYYQGDEQTLHLEVSSQEFEGMEFRRADVQIQGKAIGYTKKNSPGRMHLLVERPT